MQKGVSKGAVQVAAAIIREGGRILIARRNACDHMGGLWEFPGGKRERDETMEDCLRRELLEELEVRIEPERLWKTVRYSYPEKTVEIHFYHCRLGGGVLKAAGCQDFRWVAPDELRNFDFPPADAEIVEEIILESNKGNSRSVYLKAGNFPANLILLAASLVFISTAIEYGGRWMFDRYPTGYNPGRFFTWDATYGWSHRPNSRGTWYRYTDGTKNFVSINSEGFSDHEFSRAKKPGVKRICIIGDSVGEAWEVPPEKRYLEILRKKQDDSKKNDIEILNFSVRGYGTDQELLLLENEVSRFDPDLVMLLFCVNDLDDIFNGSGKPAFLLEDGRMLRRGQSQLRTPEWDDWDLRDPLKYVREHSWLFELFYSRIEALRKFDLLFRKISRRLFFAKEAASEELTPKPAPEELERSKWALFEEILKQMKAFCERSGTDFLVVGNFTRESLIRFSNPGAAKSPPENDLLRLETLERVCQSLGVSCIDLLAIVKARGAGTDMFRPDDPVHYNGKGNAFAADVLYDYLLKKYVA